MLERVGGESQPRIDRLALERQNAQHTLVDSAQRLATREALQALDAKGEALTGRALPPSHKTHRVDAQEKGRRAALSGRLRIEDSAEPFLEFPRIGVEFPQHRASCAGVG